MACLGLVTFLPLPERSLPRLNSCISRSTFLPALGEYLRLLDFFLALVDFFADFLALELLLLLFLAAVRRVVLLLFLDAVRRLPLLLFLEAVPRAVVRLEEQAVLFLAVLRRVPLLFFALLDLFFAAFLVAMKLSSREIRCLADSEQLSSN